jgi:GAF domain-containing protein
MIGTLGSLEVGRIDAPGHRRQQEAPVLQPLTERLRACDSMPSVLHCLLDTSLQVSGARFGNIQAMNWRAGYLELTTHRGFRKEFLQFFERVRADDFSACALALRQRDGVTVEDVGNDPGFSPRSRAIVLDAGVRAVQSIPMISTGDAFVGMLSIHFPAVHRPASGETDVIRSLARSAADIIISLRARGDLAATVQRTQATIAASRRSLARSAKASFSR